MNIYDINYEAILSRKGTLLERIKDIKDDEKTNYGFTYSIMDAKEGTPILIINTKEKEYRMNSMYRPLEEANKWANQFDNKNLGNIVSVFGFGCGYFVRALIEHLPNDTKFIIYEPDNELFSYILQNFDISDILSNKNVYIHVEGINDVNIKREYNRFLDRLHIQSHIRCYLPQYDKLYTEGGKKYNQYLSDAIFEAAVNDNTETVFAKCWIESMLNLLPMYKKANYALDIKNIIPEGITGIVVAAGPSLEKNVELLKKAKGKAIILAVNTALNCLDKHGVEPDFSVVIDSTVSSKCYSSKMSRRIPVICSYVPPKEVINSIEGRIFINNNGAFFYMVELFRRLHKTYVPVGYGGSVATTAVAFLTTIGVKNIVLVGQDLAYGEDGSTHVKGHEEDSKTTNIFNVEGVNGGMVTTRGDWLGFLKWFEQEVLIGKEEGFEIIDATEGGALIHGSTVMTLEEAIEKYCTVEFNVDEAVKNLPTFTDEEYKIVKDYIHENIDEIDYIKRKVVEGKKYAKQLLEKLKKNSSKSIVMEKNVKKISKINKDVASKWVYEMLETYSHKKISDVMEGIMRIGEDEDDNAIVSVEKNLQMYEIILESIDEFRDMYAEAYEKM